MSETLLDVAESNYNVAKTVYENMSYDERYLNHIAYHLQQAVEMAMKYQLEQNGVEYPPTHKIDQLINLAAKEKVDLHLTEYIEEHGEMFSEWEANSRYILDYGLAKKRVERAMEEVKTYLEAVREVKFLTKS